jgi:hypothetical protein
VLATIEVKSELNEKEIGRASENIESVRKLNPSAVGLGHAQRVDGAELDVDDLARENLAERILGGRDPLPMEDPLLRIAEERIWTYVFAFDGVSYETLNQHVVTHGWSRGEGPDCLCVLGNAFGSSPDAPIRTDREPSAGERFLVESTEKPLGWLLGHLVWATLRRHHREPVLRPYF